MPSPYRTPKQASREEEILAAALDLFSERGYRAVGLRELAAALEMNPATLYYYFASKDQLLFRLQLNGLQLLRQRAEATLAETAGQPAPERLRRLLKVHLDYHVEYYKTARLHFAEVRSLERESRAELHVLMKEYEGLFRDIVDEGVRTGEFEATQPKMAAFAMLGAGAMVSNWYRPGGELGQETLVEGLLDYLMRGICRER